MSKIDNIDKAIAETLRVHPEFTDTMTATICSTILNRVNSNAFTKTNGARQSIRECTSIDFLKYALDELNILYSAITAAYPKLLNNERMIYNEWNSITNNFPEADRIMNAYYTMSNIQGNLFSYYKANQNELFNLLDIVIKTRFDRRFFDPSRNDSFQYGENFRYSIDQLANRSSRYEIMKKKIDSDYLPFTNISSMNFNSKAINQCVREIMSGAQIQHHHNEYVLDGTLFATQDVGLKRKHQEDSTLIMNHPQNSEFKLLAVADGMGGVSAGEKVSNYVVSELSNWFSLVPKELYDDTLSLYKLLTQKVEEISREAYRKYGNSNLNVSPGSTLVCAVVTRDFTVILNVGDSRAYTIKDGRLNLVTEDESRVWINMKEQLKNENRNVTLHDISNLRFAPFNNQICKFIGDPNLNDIQIRVVKNEEYDKLLLFSDGVHDILSSEDIKVIANTTSPEEITKAIVNAALSKNALLRDENGMVRSSVPAGKDNTTAAAYIRR